MKKNNKYIVNVNTDLNINPDAPTLVNDFFVFGSVKGYFKISRSKYIKNLIGAPYEILNRIIINYNESLESLESLEGLEIPNCLGIEIIDNPKLKTLKSGPISVKEYFILRDNVNLLDIGYDIAKVEGDFEITACSRIKTLKGSPTNIGGTFKITECLMLNSTDTSTKHIHGNLDITACPAIKSLKGLPTKVDGYVSIDDLSELVDLGGTLNDVGNYYMIKWCDKLETLQGLPTNIKGRLLLSHLNMLEYLSEYVKRCDSISIFDCPSLDKMDVDELINKCKVNFRKF